MARAGGTTDAAAWRCIHVRPPGPDPSGPGQTQPQWTTVGNGIEDNVELAKAIVDFRDGNPYAGTPANGPFFSIFDINRVARLPRGAECRLSLNPPRKGPALHKAILLPRWVPPSRTTRATTSKNSS